MIIAIGSKALRQVLPGGVCDLDLVATPDHKPDFDSKFTIKKEIPGKTMYAGQKPIEVEWASTGSSCEELLNHGTGEFELPGVGSNSPVCRRTGEFELPGVGTIGYAPPKALASIYAAHLLFPIQWDKHAPRYWALRDAGYEVLPKLYNMRKAETANRTRYRAGRYDRPNDEFFSDSVKREIPHDELHLKIAFYGRPLYERVKRDLSRSGVCIDMFNALPRGLQLKTVWEEALVLGHERYRSLGMTDEKAARKVLFGLCTNWLPIEFRPFVLDNFRELLANFPYEMWKLLDVKHTRS